MKKQISAWDIFDAWKDDSSFTTKNETDIIKWFTAYADGAMDIMVPKDKAKMAASIIFDWGKYLEDNGWDGNTEWHRLESPLREIEF